MSVVNFLSCIKTIAILLLFSCGQLAAQERALYRVAVHNDDVMSHILFDAISNALNFDVEYVEYPNLAQAYSAVKDGQVDFLANVRNNRQRAQEVDFSKSTHIGYTYLYTKLSSDFNLDNVTKVAYAKGSILGEYLTDYNPDIQLVAYDSIAQVKEWINSGQVDGAIASIHYLKAMVVDGKIGAQLLNYDLPLKPFSIAATKGKHIEMLARIEAYVQSYKMQKLLRRSVHRHEVDVQSEALRIRLAQNSYDVARTINIAVANAAPHVFYHQDGTVDGLAVDMLLQTCTILALDCQVVSLASNSFTSLLHDFKKGEFDILGPMSATSERQKILNLSNSYYQLDIVLIKRKGYKPALYNSISQLFSERIGAMESSLYQRFIEQRLPHKLIQLFDDQKDMLNALLKEETDYLVMSRDEYNHLLLQSDEILPITEVTNIGVAASYPLAVAFQPTPEGQVLKSLFNDAMSLVDIDSLVTKYKENYDWKDTLDHQRNLRKIFQLVFFIILATLAFVFYFWHMQSKTDVLTRLYNRFALYTKYGRGLKKGQVLVYFDVNKFKNINDSYGHDVGDEVLKKIAKRIRRHWKYDSYRIGGDEFVLIGHYKVEDVHELIRDIGYFDYPIDTTPKFRVSISYGVYQSNDDNSSLDSILQSSDAQMYQSKALYHAAQ